jgi:hypothetical protein
LINTVADFPRLASFVRNELPGFSNSNFFLTFLDVPLGQKLTAASSNQKAAVKIDA